MATALETSLANLLASQNTLTTAINRIVACCSQSTAPTVAPTAAPTTAPTAAPTTAPNGDYYATLVEQQTATSTNIHLPKGFVNISVRNEDPSDGFVFIDANDGIGSFIYIKVAVQKDAQIYGIASYEAKTGSKIYITP